MDFGRADFGARGPLPRPLRHAGMRATTALLPMLQTYLLWSIDLFLRSCRLRGAGASAGDGSNHSNPKGQQCRTGCLEAGRSGGERQRQSHDKIIRERQHAVIIKVAVDITDIITNSGNCKSRPPLPAECGYFSGYFPYNSTRLSESTRSTVLNFIRSFFTMCLEDDASVMTFTLIDVQLVRQSCGACARVAGGAGGSSTSNLTFAESTTWGLAHVYSAANAPLQRARWICLHTRSEVHDVIMIVAV